MSDYDFEYERERRRNARWNTFYILIAFLIIAYIAAHFNEYREAVMGPDETTQIVEEKMIISNPGIVKIRDFRDNIIFESDNEKLLIEVLDNQKGFIVKDDNEKDSIVGVFIGDGWFSLELSKAFLKEEKLLKEEEGIIENEK